MYFLLGSNISSKVFKAVKHLTFTHEFHEIHLINDDKYLLRLRNAETSCFL